MFATIVLAASALLAPASSQVQGFGKGKQMFSCTMAPNTSRLETLAVLDYSKYYILRIDGSMQSEQGRALDGMFMYANPYFPDGLPRRSDTALYHIPDGESIPQLLPIETPKDKIVYKADHVYEVLIRVASKNFTLCTPKTYWDEPAGKGRDNLSAGRFTITAWEAISGGEEKKSSLTMDLLDPLQFHDPNSYTSINFPLVDHPILGAYNQMAKTAPRQPVVGAVTDGASLVLLRAVSEEAAPVTFKITPGDGALYPLIGNPFASAGAKSLVVKPMRDPADPTSPRHYAFAIYRPPSNWANVANPQVILSAEHEGDNDGPRKTLALARPPVVLVHGTFDTPKSCYGTRDEADDSPMTMTDRLRKAGFDHVMAVDWEATNGSADPSTFRHNQYVVSRNKGGIRDALAELRSKGFVAVQADVVCHSQGGVITRVFARGYPLESPMADSHPHFSDGVACMAQGCWYHSAENFGAGSIHRLVTISTTHMGSDICRLFTLYSEYSAQATGSQVPNGLWLDIFRAGGYVAGSGIFTGGFRDQIPGSDGLKGIGPTPVPSHAIACVSLDEDVLTQYEGFYASRMRMIFEKSPNDVIDWSFRKAGQVEHADDLKAIIDAYNAVPPSDSLDPQKRPLLSKFRSAVFGGEENDCTVRISSSFGGMTEAYRTRIPGILHGWAPRYTSVQNRVIQVLRDESLVDGNGFPDAYNGTRASPKIVPVGWSSASAPWGELDTVSNKPVAKPVERRTAEAEALVQDGNRRYAEKDVTGAKEAYRKAIEADPMFVRAYLNLAILFYNENNYEESGKLEKKAIELEPDNPQAHMQYALTLSQQGKHAESEAQYREVVRIDPKNHSAWNSMGVKQMRQNKAREAEDSFREAMTLDPENVTIITNLGKALTNQGKWDQGERYFITAMNKDPDNSEPYYALATVEFNRKNYDQAASFANQAISRKPDDGKYHAELAGALLRLGKKDEAMAAAKKAQELKHTDHWVYKELGLGS